MKKILIPTDFSNCANNAVETGIKLAQKIKAEIHFIHVQRTPVDWKNLRKEKEKNFPDTLHEIGQSKGELAKLELKAKKAKLTVKTTLVFNNNDISTALEDYIYDLIIIGSHGASGLKELIGSNTQRVVRYSKSPVLVVKDSLKKNAIQNIVFASNFEEEAHQPFQKVTQFAELVKAQIHLLYVNMPFQFKETDEIESVMQNFLKKCPRGTCSINIYNALNEERGIQKFAEKINADLIALTTHGKTGFIKMISPSITESLVNHSNLPVLSVNIKGEK